MIDHVLEREPRLKYESLGGDVTGITSSGDEITCLCLSDKILAIGTAKGNVHVLDYSGNQVHVVSCMKAPVHGNMESMIPWALVPWHGKWHVDRHALS